MPRAQSKGASQKFNHMERPLSPEIIESQIEALLRELDNHAIEQFPEEVRKQLRVEWYDAEEGAKKGKIENRGEALEYLRWFVEKLKNTPKIEK